MTPRALLPGVLLAAVLGCETAPTIATGTDAAVASDDLGPAAVSPTCGAFGDGGTLRAQGAWRVVSYEAEDPLAGDAGATDGGLDGGARTSLTRYAAEGERVVDPATGNATVLRVNGALQVTTTSVRLGLGLLRDDRFAVSPSGAPYLSTYDGSGIFTAMERLFVAPGGMVGFEFCAGEGGRLVARALGGATRRIVLEPDAAPPVSTLSLTLSVRSVSLTRANPLRAPRAALLWELAGRDGLVEAHGAAATEESETIRRAIEVAAPQSDRGAARYAVGHPALYDDLDGDGRYDPSRDALRSLSSLAVAWRDPDAALDGDELASRLRRGLQVVALHVDTARAVTVPVPLDPRSPVPLECVATGAPTGALPDVVR